MIKGIEVFVIFPILMSYQVVSFQGREDLGMFAVVVHKIAED